MRERTYYPELCLVQLAGETEVAIVDTVSDKLDLALWCAAGQRGGDQGVPRGAPGCGDIRPAIRRRSDAAVRYQVRAMVAGFGDQVGYDSLVSSLTGGSIDKAHRFSDWAARPLSPAQMAYAAADVTWLRMVYRRLLARLREEDGCPGSPRKWRS